MIKQGITEGKNEQILKDSSGNGGSLVEGGAGEVLTVASKYFSVLGGPIYSLAFKEKHNPLVWDAVLGWL